MQSNNIVLEDNVRHTFMSVVWSHKIQEKQADIFNEKYKRYEIVRIICSSLTSVGILSLIFTDPFWLKLLSTLVSFASTAISLFFKSFNIQDNINAHKKTATELLIIRNKFNYLLIEIKLENKSVSKLLENYNRLLFELGEIYRDAPNTTDKAVKRAKIALKVNKDNEFTDEEIDLNLSETLRKR